MESDQVKRSVYDGFPYFGSFCLPCRIVMFYIVFEGFRITVFGAWFLPTWNIDRPINLSRILAFYKVFYLFPLGHAVRIRGKARGQFLPTLQKPCSPKGFPLFYDNCVRLTRTTWAGTLGTYWFYKGFSMVSWFWQFLPTFITNGPCKVSSFHVIWL